MVKFVKIPCEMKELNGKQVLSVHLSDAGEFSDGLNRLVIAFSDGTVLRASAFANGGEVDESGLTIEIDGEQVVQERQHGERS